MEIGIGIIIVVLLVGGYVVGRLSATSNPTVTVGTNSADVAACKEACDQWDARRAERCNAEKDEAAAKAKVDAARSAFYAALAAAGGAAAAAWAMAQVCKALVLPWLVAACYGVVAGLVIVAAAAAVYASYLLGQLGAAETDFANKSSAASAARAAETAARAIVSSKCQEPDLSNCLKRPSPC